VKGLRCGGWLVERGSRSIFIDDDGTIDINERADSWQSAG
jgi:hypothetical protein